MKKKRINKMSKILIKIAVDPIKKALAKSNTKLAFKYTKILATIHAKILTQDLIANSPSYFYHLQNGSMESLQNLVGDLK